MNRAEEAKERKDFKTSKARRGQIFTMSLAGLTSSGPAALMEDTWFLVISKCGHIILEKASFTKVADKEDKSGLLKRLFKIFTGKGSLRANGVSQ